MRKLKLKHYKKSFVDLKESLYDTIENEWLRVSIIGFIILLALLFWQFNWLGIKEESFHVFLEFVGVFIIFLLVEHALRKMESGLEDPKYLPMDKFLLDLGNARLKENEIIIFDTFLETVLLQEDNCNSFRKNLKEAMLANVLNNNFSIKILCLDPNSSRAASRAQDRNDILSADDYRNRMIRAMERLKHIKLEVCDEIFFENDGKYHDGNTKDLNSIQSKITIKQYDDDPPFSMYSINNYAYISFYQKGIKSTSSRQLYAPADTEFGKNIFNYFRKTFNDIWQKAIEVKAN